MKFKTLMLASIMLATAAIFTYCTKETTSQEQTQVSANTDGDANSRNGCKVTIQAIGGCLDICGTQSNPVVCSPGYVGSGFVAMGGNQTYGVNAPCSLRITRGASCVSAQNVTAVVTTSSGAVFAYNVPPGGVAVVNVDAACNL